MPQPMSDLSARLVALNESLKETLQLIQRLSTFHTAQEPTLTNGAMNVSNTDNDTEADLAAEIHDVLNQHEEELELLKLDIEDVVLPATNRRSTRRDGEREREGSNLIARSARLTEEFAAARTRFRKAQLQVKRNADLARSRERADYLASLQAAANTSPPSATGPEEPSLSHAEMRTSLFTRRGPSRTANSSSATKDDMVLTASSDLTTSLRRTHALLSNEVSRSRFAHETLASSNAALQELNTRYGTLDDILSRSRGLLGTLLSSQKSDTWYLQTAMYVLVGTIVWLLFRRLLYGPLWWFMWFPLRTAFRTTGWAVGGAISLAGRRTSDAATTSLLISTNTPQVVQASVAPVAAHYAQQERDQQDYRKETDQDETMSDLVARMVEASQAMVGGTATAGSAGAQPMATAGSEEHGVEANQSVGAGVGQAAGPGTGHGAGQAAGQGAGQGDQGAGQAQPVRRGDGHVLRDRDPVAEPPNPKKRMWEEPLPPQQQQQREL